jgi:hypothetical protein
VRTALYCGECWRFTGYANGGEDVITWITCDGCLARLAGRGKLAGAQPAVCLWCRSPFEATRHAQSSVAQVAGHVHGDVHGEPSAAPRTFRRQGPIAVGRVTLTTRIARRGEGWPGTAPLVPSSGAAMMRTRYATVPVSLLDGRRAQPESDRPPSHSDDVVSAVSGDPLGPFRVLCRLQFRPRSQHVGTCFESQRTKSWLSGRFGSGIICRATSPRTASTRGRRPREAKEDTCARSCFSPRFWRH